METAHGDRRLATASLTRGLRSPRYIALGNVDDGVKAVQAARNAVRTKGNRVDTKGFGVQRDEGWSIAGVLGRVLGTGWVGVRNSVLMDRVEGPEWEDMKEAWVNERGGKGWWEGKRGMCGKGEEEVLAKGEFGVYFCKKYEHHKGKGGATGAGGGGGGKGGEL